MTNLLRAWAVSLLLLGATWLGTPTAVHADVMPPLADAGVAADGSRADAGPPQHTGLPPFGCTVAGVSVSVGPSIVLVLTLGLARRRRARRQ